MKCMTHYQKIKSKRTQALSCFRCDQRYKCTNSCCPGFTISPNAPCTVCGKSISKVFSLQTTQTGMDTKHFEQIGNKRRIIGISVGVSDNFSCSFPMAVVSLGKSHVFDAKEKTCTIKSTSISFGAYVHGTCCLRLFTFR